MNSSPDIEWLQRKWGLPGEAVPAVLALLKEESRGSTACAIGAEVRDFGNAAGDAEGTTPLVITEHAGGRFLQSRRLHRAEREIAGRLLELAGNESPLPFAAKALPKLFPGAGENGRQPDAARAAMTRQLAVITGGPGTGKTYALARILALLVASGIPADMIRLAAPTGKAADRMKAAVSDSLAGLPDGFKKHMDSLARIAESGMTLHKLVGYNPQKGRARFDASQPLPCRVLIVDECSMVDVMLWRTVLLALPRDARLVLIGDPNQLESVGEGNVFAEVVRSASVPGSALAPTHVHLTEARRFKDRPDILAFARALERSDPVAAAEILERAEGPGAPRGIGWLKCPGAVLPCADFPRPVLESLEKVARASTPQDALDALGKICILTAQRDFFVGSQAMSAAIGQHFFQQEGARNQPVIINRNDPETGLRNGTVGVIHTDADGRRKAWFHAGDGRLKEVPVAKLPDFSPAWAITIHRSQGSEYDDVLVVLPREESPMTTRALLYTAITRAKRTVYIAGELGSVKKAATTTSDRRTMLAAFLRPDVR